MAHSVPTTMIALGRGWGVLAVLLCGAALAACAPDLGPKPQMTPPAALSATRSFAAAPAPWPKQDWWIGFADPQLTTLIETGLNSAPDLAIAAARLRAAQAQAESAGASTLPSLSAGASIEPTRQSLNMGFPPAFQSFLPQGWHSETEAAFNASYDLDFWGKNRAALAAATSEAEAAEAELAQARLTLSTAIATAYAQLVQLTADLATQKDAVHVREESAKLVESRVQFGLENTGQLAQARAEIAIAQSQADQLSAQIARTRHQIAALLGEGPDAGLDIAVSVAEMPAAPGLPANLPADLAGRRPDLVAARLQAEAAAEQVHIAKVGYYPDISLSGQFGLLSLNPSDFLKHTSMFGAVGPAIHLPIFTGGALEGSYRGARAGYDEAVANYNKTLATAFAQIADALSDQASLKQELTHAQEALEQSQKAYEVAKTRYRGGLSRYLDVLTAENTVLLQRRQLTDLQAQRFIDDIALIRALGGGFEASPQTLTADRSNGL